MDRFAKDLAAAKERDNRMQRELAKRLSDKLSEVEARVVELETCNAALRAESDALCRKLEEVSRLLGEEELRNA